MASPTLDAAIVEYIDSRRARGIKKGTLANERVVLKQLLASVGNLLVKNLTSRHIDMYFTAHPHFAASTWNRNTAYLEGFFKWCRSRRYMPRDADPLEGISKRKEIQRDFIFLPAERFEELLNAARHQRDRAVLAIGLYTFQRASELTRLTWDDVHDTDPDPRKWEIAIYRKKTDERDWLPLCLELKEELQRWRLEYGRMCGQPPRGDWLVVPAFDRGEWGQNPTTRLLERKSPLKLNPKAPITNCQDIIHRALKGIGFDDTKQEGAHT
ncbi:MAG TPA: hypothetical protein VFH56_00300, partial [Acidimicrobiales bacterium]|nr:hypothetical protein [Acidimicrobiales bacterium]